jgi:hypothetical protein
MNSIFLKTICISIALFLFGTLTVKSQTIHLEALDAYWKITERLKQGDTLSREAWQQFMDMDGNREYIRNQAFDARYMESYRKAMQTVYLPKNAEKLKMMMEKKFDYWIEYKVNQYKVHEAELKAYATHLKESAYLDSIYKQVWAWLPERLHRKSAVDIYFIGIDNDALVEKGTIVFTLWAAYNQDLLKYGILGAHEMHHILRGAWSPGKISAADEGLMYVLNVVLNEGSADMIDKKYTIDNLDKVPGELQFDFILDLESSGKIIGQIDSCIRIMAASNGEKFTSTKQYRKIIKYTSGHNPGYYMADVIVRNGFKKELLEHIQDPFNFFRLYDKAARKDKKNPVRFSAASMKYCKALEKKYRKA